MRNCAWPHQQHHSLKCVCVWCLGVCVLSVKEGREGRTKEEGSCVRVCVGEGPYHAVWVCVWGVRVNEYVGVRVSVKGRGSMGRVRVSVCEAHYVGYWRCIGCGVCVSGCGSISKRG